MFLVMFMGPDTSTITSSGCLNSIRDVGMSAGIYILKDSEALMMGFCRVTDVDLFSPN